MKIDINSLGRNPSEFEINIDPNEIELDETALVLNDELKLACKAWRNAERIELEGTIAANIRLNCSRCLTGVDTGFDFPFRSVFVMPEEFPAEKELELEVGDLDIDIFEGEEISLADVAREQLLLELPEIIICSQECKGLCEVCGIDRNKETCECGSGDIDPRWAGLKNLIN